MEFEDINYSEKEQSRFNDTQDDIIADYNLYELEWLFNATSRMLPVVTIGGLLLQLFNLIVLLCSNQMRSNMSSFLSAMTISDVLFLLVQLPALPAHFIVHTELNASITVAMYYAFEQRFYIPYVQYPLSLMCHSTNTWLVVLISIERILALKPECSCVCTPCGKVSRRKLTLTSIGITVLLSMALNVSCVFEDPNSNANTARKASELGIETLEKLGAVVRFVLSYLLPFVLLLSLNTALACLLVRLRRKQLRLLPVPRGIGQQENGGNSRCVSFSHGTAAIANRVHRSVCSHQSENASDPMRCNRQSRKTLNTTLLVLVAVFVHLAISAPDIALTLFVCLKGQTVFRANTWLVIVSHAINVLVHVHCCIDSCALQLEAYF